MAINVQEVSSKLTPRNWESHFINKYKKLKNKRDQIVIVSYVKIKLNNLLRIQNEREKLIQISPNEAA